MSLLPINGKRLLNPLALFCAFSFRLAIGLSSQFFLKDTTDEKQIYLIGLKFYTTGKWPYFGPDVAPAIQIPGALQGLAVGVPFYLLSIPEAPFLLLNALSFAALLFFAWYCNKRLPSFPKGILYAWLLTAPWSLGFSTQINNPSYVLFGAVLFFVGAIESYPFLSARVLPRFWPWFLMGFGMMWIMQFHLSWIVLLVYIPLSLYFQARAGWRTAATSIAYLVAGAIIPVSVLIPTVLRYGLRSGLGNTNTVVDFQPLNSFAIVEGVLGRFLSFASYEVPRFIGSHTAERLAFMNEHKWLIPFVVFLTIVGVLQCIALLVLWFRKRTRTGDWPGIKYFTLGTVLLLYVGFVFSMKSPASHTFYLTFPVAMLYSFYCWNDYLQKKIWRTFAWIVIVSGITFEAGLAAHNYKHSSIYVDRGRIQHAIDAKDYRILGERREGSRY